MIDYNEKYTLYKIRNTLVELLEDRKYTVEDKYKVEFNEFCKYLEKNNIDIYATGEKGNMYVYI